MAKHTRLDLVGREETPPCFHLEGDDYGTKEAEVLFWAWNEAACDGDGVGSSSFCTDCTPEYKAQEFAAGRCSFPGVTFQRDPYDPDAIIGVRPAHEKVPSKWKRIRFDPPEGTAPLIARLIPSSMIDGLKGETE